MLKNAGAFSSFSVLDIKAAKDFYSGILGLDVSENEMGILEFHLPGGMNCITYPKKDHVPATFTILNFRVNNIKETVDGLKKLGVVFESYHLEGLNTDEDNISRGNGPTIAWLKDPSGNILSIIEEEH